MRNDDGGSGCDKEVLWTIVDHVFVLLFLLTVGVEYAVHTAAGRFGALT